MNILTKCKIIVKEKEIMSRYLSVRCSEDRPINKPLAYASSTLPAHGELEAGPVAPGHLGPRHRLPGSLPAIDLALARLQAVRLRLLGHCLVTVLAQC